MFQVTVFVKKITWRKYALLEAVLAFSFVIRQALWLHCWSVIM